MAPAAGDARPPVAAVGRQQLRLPDHWVFADPAGDGWHMLITARASHGPVPGRGVLGHAWSADLLNWEVRPPLTQPAGFGHLEVPQVAVVDGQPLLLFCTNPGSDPIWIVPGPSVTGPWDITLARPVRCPGLYAPRLVRDGSGAWHLIGFTTGPHRRFRRRALRSRPGSLHLVRRPGVRRATLTAG